MTKKELEELTLDGLIEHYHTIEEIEKNIPIERLILKFPEIEKASDDEKGVLSAKYIEQYSNEYKLIFPFDRKRLRGASYVLDVGDDYAIQGDSNKLIEDTGKNEIKIDPFQVAIIKTRQIINMPRFLIGRWNIKVSRAYEGLLWVGGPQVDPGWVGHLYCPVYNLSNKTIILRLGEELATIDFVKAGEFDKRYKDRYIERPPKRTRLEHYKPILQSALYTEAAKRIDKIEDKIEKQIERRVNRVEGLIGPIFTSISIMVALIGLLLASRSVPSEAFSVPLWVVIWLSFSIAFSIGAIVINLYKGKSEITGRWGKTGVIIIFVLGILIGALAVQYKYSKDLEALLRTPKTLNQEPEKKREIGTTKPSLGADPDVKTQGSSTAPLKEK